MTHSSSFLRLHVSPPIRQALPANALECVVGALNIVYTKSGAEVVAEVELLHVAVKVLFANMMERADQAALEDRKVAFDRVGRDVAANIFACAMVHGLVRGKHAME